MATSQVTATRGLFDDAGLFPPSALPMAEALATHQRNRTGPNAALTGPFLCPADRFAELDACVAAGAERPPRLGVIAYGGPLGWARMRSQPGIVQVEAPVGTDLSSVPDRTTRYLEVSPNGDLAASLDAVARAGARAKVRCGGLTRDAVPMVPWLAAVLVGCAERGLLLKATAGLHEPFHRRGPDGIHHGFVNLLAGAAAALAGVPTAIVAEVLSRTGDLSGDMARSMGRGRQMIASIGTCSIDEPAAALAAHGLR